MEYCRHATRRLAGWVVKNLGVRKSVRGTAFYLLSHAAKGILPTPDQRGPEVVTWAGSMAYNRLRIEDPAPRPIRCAVCGQEISKSDWFQLQWIGSDPPPEAEAGACDRGCWELAHAFWDAPDSVE